MNELNYTYAVARIRCNESKLLSHEKIEQLICASDFFEAYKRLGDIGYETLGGAPVSDVLAVERKKAWQLLCEIAPDKKELEFLTVRNSFMNLKAALKSVVSGKSAGEFFVEPANVADDIIKEAVTSKNFSSLPEYMADTASYCYDILTSKDDGQLSDSVIDKKSLETYLEFAKRSKNAVLKDIAEFTVACADIKIAYRSALTKKDIGFLDASLAECAAIDLPALKKAAASGVDSVIDALSHTEYSEAAELLKTSPTAFEKWCDDTVISKIIPAKYNAFGILPLIGFYLAKENEVKTVRIIMAAKESGLPESAIRERVRKLYV